jgi:hypothetical protein
VLDLAAGRRPLADCLPQRHAAGLSLTSDVIYSHMLPVGISGVVPVEQMFGDDAEDTVRLEADLQVARRYLLNQKWCFGIRSMYFGTGLGSIAAVFLAELDQPADGVDEWLWVVVGDVPPAYMIVDVCSTPIAALEAYVELIKPWVDLAREGKQSVEVFPVSMLATPENAEKLQKRLDALTATVIPWIRHGMVVQ